MLRILPLSWHNKTSTIVAIITFYWNSATWNMRTGSYPWVECENCLIKKLLFHCTHSGRLLTSRAVMGSGKVGHSTSPSRTSSPHGSCGSYHHSSPRTCGCCNHNSRVYRLTWTHWGCKVIVPTSEKGLEAARELHSSPGINPVNLETCPDWNLSSKSRHIQI